MENDSKKVLKYSLIIDTVIMLIGTVTLGMMNQLSINSTFFIQGIILAVMTILACFIYEKHSFIGPLLNTVIAALWISITGFSLVILLINAFFILENVILLSLSNRILAMTSLGLPLVILVIFRLINPIVGTEPAILPDIKALNLVIERYKTANDYGYSLSSSPLQIFCCPGAKCKDTKPNDEGFFPSQMYGSYEEFETNLKTIFTDSLLQEFIQIGLVRNIDGKLYCQEGGREKDPRYLGEEQFSKVSIDKDKIIYNVKVKYLSENAPAACIKEPSGTDCTYVYRVYTIHLGKVNKQWVVSEFALAY